ncbi:hypothetical protein DUNSADRAFT_3588 [Dunaliella salina]|uniref:Uncharacterized protein n=1 Tax=Dunaliella salina TaxID=3046 RepID=A0ABQ7GTY8_DUNSA|nr:hypothetical protein DUNSADRAFT_3588 [Dunaliella salina]|eukprot:KAF5837995.1 hypothetical protein DUNSADRAFT_3588 [Dunaliella salina]
MLLPSPLASPLHHKPSVCPRTATAHRGYDGQGPHSAVFAPPHISNHYVPLRNNHLRVQTLTAYASQAQRSNTLHPTQLRHPIIPSSILHLPDVQQRASVAASATATASGAAFKGRGYAGGQGFKEDLDAITPQPAFSATLRMLEWHRICEHLSAFASTAAGKQACLELGFPRTEEGSQVLLRQTRAAIVLQYDYAVGIDFGGIDSQGAASAIVRAQKAGMCSAAQLRAAAALAVGADRIRKQVLAAVRENEGGRPANSPLAPLIAAVSSLAPQPVFVRDIHACISEENVVQDSASDVLSRCRMRIRSLTSKLSNLLKGYGGEVSEQGGRVCVAMAGGSKLSAGSLMLGSSPGGGLMYVEPPGAVSLNNELAAARGECYSAEEDVLWSLTNQMMGVLEELERMYEVVIWLDVLSSKARYAIWLDAVLPSLVPWNQVFHARGAGAAKQRAQAVKAAQESGIVEEGTPLDDDEGGAGGLRYAVRLRGLRHPLLLGDYLKEKEQLERALRQAGGDPAMVQAISRAGSSSSAGVRLSKSRQAMMEAAGFGASSAPRRSKRGINLEEQQARIETLTNALLKLKPPVPLDLLIKPHISAVVITGPNTGGKTATMKALGLSALMARAGLAIPAEQPAALPAYSSVLADIGDEQSLTANLSTFSGHLARIQVRTGSECTKKRGVGSGALTIATTHHSLMTSLKFEDPQGRFENASVEFDEVALAPTYHLLWGIPGRSNAINIASRLGLNQEVVGSARAGLDTSMSVADDTIKELEEARVRLRNEETARWVVEQDLAALQQQVDTKKREAEALRQELLAARSQSIFDLWVAARQRLAELRRKRVVTPPSPRVQPSLPTELGAPKESTQSAEQAQPVVVEGAREHQEEEEETEEDDDVELPPRLDSRRAGPGALSIDAYLDMSEDVMDLVGQLEAKMLEREQRKKAEESAQQEVDLLPDIVKKLESREAAALPRPNQEPIHSPESQKTPRFDAASPESFDQWMESVVASEESRPVESSEGVGSRKLNTEETEEVALMLLALQQIEDGRPGGLGARQQQARREEGWRGSSASASANGGSIDEDELLMLQALGQLEMHQAMQPRKQQQERQQQRKKRKHRGKSRTG